MAAAARDERPGHPTTRPAAPDTLGRQFAVRELNRVWAGDVTACWTDEGWLYLAALLDLGSRRVVGWATSATLDQVLTARALRRALAQRQPATGLLHHSDRGTHYTAAEYQAAITAAGLAASMKPPRGLLGQRGAQEFRHAQDRVGARRALGDAREATVALAAYTGATSLRRLEKADPGGDITL